MRRFFEYEMPVGVTSISETDGKIDGVNFGATDWTVGADKKETSVIKKAFEELSEYFSGKRMNFDIPVYLSGTEFQLSVWKALVEIPYGQTRSYKDIAIAVGVPKGFRAVGLANNRNPISILIPCHRVIGTDGRLVGYGGGLNIKKFLLDLERKYVNSTQN